MTQIDDVNILWLNYSGEMECKCGREVFIDSESYPAECECGRTYQLISYVIGQEEEE